MNTDEVTEMIDDITDGRPTVHNWVNPKPSQPHLFVATGPDKLVLSDVHDDFVFAITDPRVAREIAGALIAWATHKDGLAGLNERARLVKPDFRAESNLSYGADEPGNPHPGSFHGSQVCPTCRRDSGVWRGEWYRRNVDGMSQVTKDRNFADLHSELTTRPMSPEVKADIEAAIKILFDAGAKRRV